MKIKKIDTYFSKYKIGMQIDEYNQMKAAAIVIMKKAKHLMIESHGITITRTNPYAPDVDMNRLISEIYNHIIESSKNQTKVSTKKSLIDDLSKR